MVTLVKRSVIAFNADSLNGAAEFDHPFEVLPGGIAIDGPPSVYAPDVEGDTAPDGWEFVDGYSGQYGYSGPIMHPSEYLGGGMARDVLDTPGVYVIVEPSDDDPLCGECGQPIGWSQVAYDYNGTEYIHTTGMPDDFHDAEKSSEPIGWALLRKV